MNNFSRRHFGDIDIKELIHYYRHYECLWNLNSVDYKNTARRQEAWQDIANYFNKNISEVKRKIKYLRTAYVAEKKKVVASRKNGSTPYKPSLFYFKELDFLDNVVVWRKNPNGQDNNDIEFKNFEMVAEETADFISYVEDVDAGRCPKINCKVESYDEDSPVPSPSLPKCTNNTKIQTSALPSRPTKRKYHESVTYNKDCESFITSTSKENNNHLSELYSSFGKTISLQLQQLPLETAVVTMSEIQAIITNKTLEYIKYTKNNKTYSHLDSDNRIIELLEENVGDM